jgi:dUTP pyrophosphatase
MLLFPELKIKCHYPGMPVPVKAHADDSGLDLTLIRVIQKRDTIFFFDTGVSVEPPKGYYTELYPRSSIYKHDFMMTNSVGVIDSGYRGILYMPMRYLGMGDGKAEAENLIGSRIGQLVLKKLEPFEIKVSEQLSDSDRGEGGFGSSGS